MKSKEMLLRDALGNGKRKW